MLAAYDVVIVGAGLVGLAVASRLRQMKPDFKVAVFEKEATVAAHQSSHNSGVIHSGLYYKPGSEKARLCLSGYRDLLRFCDENGVAYTICGKLVVANGRSEEQRLEALRQRGEKNGLKGLAWLSSEEAREKEPWVRCSRALWVPQTGVVSFKSVAERLYETLMEAGIDFYFEDRLLAISRHRLGLSLATEGRAVTTRLLVNCAGLYADKIAEMDPDIDHIGVQILPFRGEYYHLKPASAEKVRGLIYPVPNPSFPFLGVHLTRGIDGSVEAGPNAVLALSREGYGWSNVNLDEFLESLTWPGFYRLAARHWRPGLEEVARSFSKAKFLASLQQLVPSLEMHDLQKGGSGVRAQAIDKSGKLLDDFYFLASGKSLHVLNAPSPAATSSFAIGQEIVRRLLPKLL